MDCFDNNVKCLLKGLAKACALYEMSGKLADNAYDVQLLSY